MHFNNNRTVLLVYGVYIVVVVVVVVAVVVLTMIMHLQLFITDQFYYYVPE